jgi:transposase
MFLQVPAAVRVFLCNRPTDMRKGFDGLQDMVREYLGQDPLSGHLFLFLNRRRDRIKILLWEPDGWVIWYKRLEVGTFQQIDPGTSAGRSSGKADIELSPTDLALLRTGVDLASARRRKRYARAGWSSWREFLKSLENSSRISEARKIINFVQ